MVYCVGLTGDIASGKTTVAELFSQLEIEVIHADKISRMVTQKNQPAYIKISKHFGNNIIQKDREINRSLLREIIFANKEERTWLENLLHPLIRQEIKKRVDACTTPYCIVEIPLLITKQAYPYIKRILLIRAPVATQISRMIRRDHCTQEQAHAILAAQPDLNRRLENTDDVIINNITHDELAKRVNTLHHQYLQESKHFA
ncbi:MAG: dephospho-CoA kinase [Legionella sp.]